MIEENIQYKYKIKQKLDELPHKDYMSAVKVLPKELKISSATFHKYLNVRIYEGYSISADHIARLAKFFDCSMEDLLNYTAPDLKLRGMKKHGKIDIKRRFQLVK